MYFHSKYLCINAMKRHDEIVRYLHLNKDTPKDGSSWYKVILECYILMTQMLLSTSSDITFLKS